MDNRRIAAELTAVARELVASTDLKFIADQMLNAWEHYYPTELADLLADRTSYDDRDLLRVLKRWYNDADMRRRMDLWPTSRWVSWLRKELR